MCVVFRFLNLISLEGKKRKSRNHTHLGVSILVSAVNYILRTRIQKERDKIQ